MRVRLELYGISRLIAGTKELSLEWPEGATFRDIVRLLVTRYPDMIGDVVQPDGETLQSPNIFNLNGERMIHVDHMEDALSDGDQIILMSMSAGG